MYKLDNSSGSDNEDQVAGAENFQFFTNKIRTVPDLTKGFEHRTDVFDRLLLYFLTDCEIDSCMQAWQEDVETPELAKTVKNFESKYLSAQLNDNDVYNVDEEQLANILLLPNGHKLSLGPQDANGFRDESLITASIDLKQLLLKSKEGDQLGNSFWQGSFPLSPMRLHTSPEKN